MNNPLVQPDPGLYIWTIVTFLVLLAAAGEVRLAAAARGARAAAGRDPQVARRCAEGEAGAGAAARRVAAHPRRGARAEAEQILVADAIGRQSVSRRDEAEGAGRSGRHRQERREADRARDRARAAADPPRSGRHLGGDRVEAAAAQRVEGRQRAADRRNVQADRSAASRTDR